MSKEGTGSGKRGKMSRNTDGSRQDKQNDSRKNVEPKKPNILDLLSKQRTGQTAQCPVCERNVLVSKMNHHLDSGCLATGSNSQAASSSCSVDTSSCDNKSQEDFASDTYKYDRTVPNDSTKKNVSKRKASTASSSVSPYFDKQRAAKRSKLKLKKKALSFTASELDNVESDSGFHNAQVVDLDPDIVILDRPTGEVDSTVISDEVKSVNRGLSRDAKVDSCSEVQVTNSEPSLDDHMSTCKGITNPSTPNISISNNVLECSTSSTHTQVHLKSEISQKTPQVVSELTTDSTDISPASSVSDISTSDVTTPSSGALSSTSVAMPTRESPMTSQESVQAPSDGDENGEEEDGPKHPYYLSNFFLVMDTVLDNKEDSSLFNEDDMSYIDKFKSLSGEAQKLYVRLFQRKPTWLRVEKLDYPKIAADLKPVAKELVAAGFLITENDLTDIEETLRLLQAPDLKSLAKSLKVTCSGMQRNQIIDALMKHGRQQRSIFGGTASLILRRAKKALGSCVKLVRDVKAIFTRLVLLFSLKNVADEDDFYANGGQSLLSALFLANYGRVVYPNYTVYRPTVLFRSRDEFLRFQVALQYEADVSSALNNNDFETALEVYSEACKEYEPIRNDPDILSFDKSLPVFLRCFTTSWIYTRIQALGVEILQKLRRYGEAVDKLKELLGQEIYCTHARGRWWDRLALNLDQHLKKPSQSLDAIKEALADSHVRTGHRLALEQRVFKICESPSNQKLKKRLSEFSLSKLKETPKVVISGNIRQNDVVNERFYVIQKQNEDRGDAGAMEEILTSRVEEFVLHYYKENGYNEGLHGEGATFTTLIGLLMWDIVFSDNIPDVFRYPFQTGPLDFRGDDFYINRQEMIEARLNLIEKCSVDALQRMVEETWKAHESEQCCLVDWNVFDDLDRIKGLIACMGGPFLSAIGRRIMKDHRHCRGGVPDLVVWNTEKKTYRIVEVKGPNDRLAHKQILWIDFLNSVGATAEVCHVTAVGGKKLRTSME